MIIMMTLGLQALLAAATAPHPATAAAGKQVFAHYMLCFAAFGEKGNSSNATAGYMKEMAVAQASIL